MQKRSFPTDKELLDMANEVRKNSYHPYSNISVGAALLTGSGKVYCGANIENAAFTPTVCAERVAIFKAYSEGERKFIAIAIVGGTSNESSREPFPPCGVCRQVMAEFCDADFKIIMPFGDGYRVNTLGELLPLAFKL